MGRIIPDIVENKKMFETTNQDLYRMWSILSLN
jgi:hypothetical protein